MMVTDFASLTFCFIESNTVSETSGLGVPTSLVVGRFIHLYDRNCCKSMLIQTDSPDVITVRQDPVVIRAV